MNVRPLFVTHPQSPKLVQPCEGPFHNLAPSAQSAAIEVYEGELFAFAGLWDRWKDFSGSWVQTCSILTTTPNSVAGKVHDRMPVILDPDSYDLWLDPGMTNVQVISELLNLWLMRCYAVRTRINHVANDDEECSKPVEVGQTQNPLFA